MLCGLLLLLPCACLAAEAGDGQQAQLQKLHAYVAEVQQQLSELQSALSRAEARNREQSGLIDRLEQGLRARERSGPAEQMRARAAFFDHLRTHLPPSPVYRVLLDRVVLAADPIFVFSRAHLGAEGEARLQDLGEALGAAIDLLPDDLSWRLSVEGHTDSRPVRSNSTFSGNWELSAARATEVVRFLVRRGLPEARLVAVAWAATVPFSGSRQNKDYRRDRRIELRLTFPR